MAQAKVLLVDRDKPFRHLCEEWFKAEGFFVVLCDSFVDCIGFLRKEIYDLLVVSLPLDNKDIEFVKGIRTISSDQAILVLTKKEETVDLLKSMEDGIMDCLPKPIGREQLLIQAHRLIEKKQLLRDRSRLIKEGLEYLEILSVYQRCTQLLATLDFHTLYPLILDSFLAEAGGESGILWIKEGETSENLTIQSSRGGIKPQNFSLKFVLFQHPYSLLLSQGKPFFSKDPPSRKELYIPLVREGDTIGLVYIVRRDRDFYQKEINICKTISDFAYIATKNSFSFQRLSRGTMKEHVGSSIYTSQFFIEYASKEILKARRYQKVLSFLLLTIENYPSLSGSFGESVLKDFVDKMMNAVGEAMRGSDLVARHGEASLLVLLPETDHFGSLMSARRIRRVLKSKRYIADQTAHMPVNIAVSSATFPRDGEDVDGLISALSLKLEQQRKSYFARLNLEGKNFWSIVSALVDMPQTIKESDTHSMRIQLNSSLLAELQKEIFNEIVLEKDRRGFLFIGGETMGSLSITGDVRSKIYLISRSSEENISTQNQIHPAVTQVSVPDENMKLHQFILFLNEDYAYGIICRNGDGLMLPAFHTDDSNLVDKLIVKLQEQYSLLVEAG